MEWEARGKRAAGWGEGASPGSSYLYGSPSLLQRISHQARAAQAMVCGTGIPGKADEGVPEPARGGRFPQGSAGPATRAPQMGERSRRRTAPAVDPTARPTPAEVEVEDRLNDWPSRLTGFQPKRWPGPVTTECEPSTTPCSTPCG